MPYYVISYNLSRPQGAVHPRRAGSLAQGAVCYNVILYCTMKLYHNGILCCVIVYHDIL